MKADQIEDEFMNPDSFKKMLARLEKAINVNQDMRLKYAKEPERFLDSEVELDDCIRSLTSLSAYPDLFQIFARSKILPNVIMLLQHENIDISGGVINFLQELVSATVETEQADDLLLLYSSLVSCMIFEAIVECIERFNETKQEEAELVHKCLSILENMIEIRSSYCRDICNRTK
jgi:beta-catenin-like protein 1